MSKFVVADSSCLISLSRIGKLEVLHDLFGGIIIPEAVYYEVVVRGAGRTGAEEVKKAKWIKKQKVQNALAVGAFKVNLGAGESEAIALASESKAAFLILDDFKARQTAEELSLEVIGTVAVLQKAEEKGIIDNLQSVLQDLRDVGFYFLSQYDKR
jgi:predicted nucleic acid-binding protein